MGVHLGQSGRVQLIRVPTLTVLLLNVTLNHWYYILFTNKLMSNQNTVPTHSFYNCYSDSLRKEVMRMYSGRNWSKATVLSVMFSNNQGIDHILTKINNFLKNWYQVLRSLEGTELKENFNHYKYKNCKEVTKNQ